MTPQLLGPLPVQVFIHTGESRLLLRGAGTEISSAIQDPLSMLLELGLVQLGAAPAVAGPATVRQSFTLSAPPPEPAAPNKPHRKTIDDRPTSKLCDKALGGCGKTYPVKKAGRVPAFCSPNCKSKAAREAKRAAKPATVPGPPLPSTQPPIEESGGGMRARIKAMNAAGGPKGPTLLDNLREKNRAVAKRSGGRA